MCEEYNNLYVLKWSFWVITATCCFNQVKIFVIYLIIIYLSNILFNNYNNNKLIFVDFYHLIFCY